MELSLQLADDTDQFSVTIGQFIETNVADTLADRVLAQAAATAAAASQAAALASQTDADGAATSAGTSATNAATSATAAGLSATAAANAATTAGTQASNAMGSASAAAGSATTAGTAATNANNSANAAALSASNAATTLTNALVKTNNLSDVANLATALANIGGLSPTAALAQQRTNFYRNRIFNGGFQQANRPNTVLSGNTFGYGCGDYWLTSISTGSISQIRSNSNYNGTQIVFGNQQVVTPPTSLASGNLYGGFQQTFEQAEMFDLIGSPLLLSFVFVGPVAGAYSVALTDYAGANSYATLFTVTSANVGAKVRYTVPIPALPSTMNGSSSVNNSAGGMVLRIGTLNNGTYQCPIASLGAWSTSGNWVSGQGAVNWAATANNTMAISQVCLRAGTVDIAYDEEPVALQVLKAARRYQLLTLIYSTTTGGMYSFQTMRAAPTITPTTIGGGSGGVFSACGPSALYQSAANSSFTSGTITLTSDI